MNNGETKKKTSGVCGCSEAPGLKRRLFGTGRSTLEARLKWRCKNIVINIDKITNEIDRHAHSCVLCIMHIIVNIIVRDLQFTGTHMVDEFSGDY